MNKQENKANIDLSIIIINYNTKEITLNCLKSLETSLMGEKIRYEIILIDNCSQDGSFEAFSSLAKNNSQVRYYYQKENLGYSKANNLGARLAKGKYLLFLNSDTFILNKAIIKLFSFYKKNEKEMSFVGPKLLNFDLSPQPSAGYFFNLLVTFFVLFLKGDQLNLTRFSPKAIKKVDWISGACFLTKKEIFEAIGGFDEKIFMYMDEVDFFYRAQKMSHQTYFYPEAKIIHYGSASSSKTYPILQLYRGLIYFYQKHYSFVALQILKLFLVLKALMAILFGRILNDRSLLATYSQALKLV